MTRREPLRERRKKPGYVERLERKDFVVTDTRGRMTELYCKVCGEQIGGLNARSKFYRFKNYAEVMFTFVDDSKHVTNCCTDCVYDINDSSRLMKLMHDADIDYMAQDNPAMLVEKQRRKPKVTRLNANRSGLT